MVIIKIKHWSETPKNFTGVVYFDYSKFFLKIKYFIDIIDLQKLGIMD